MVKSTTSAAWGKGRQRGVIVITMNWSCNGKRNANGYGMVMAMMIVYNNSNKMLLYL